MSIDKTTIPVNTIGENFDAGIAVGRMQSNNLRDFKEAEYAHRHDFHFFMLQEKGTFLIEIDFKKHKIEQAMLLYLHPEQVHRIVEMSELRLSVLAIPSEYLNLKYLQQLEELKSIPPVALSKEKFQFIQKAFSFCIEIAEHPLLSSNLSVLKDGSNTLVGVMLAQFLSRVKPVDELSRFEWINRRFKAKLESHFKTLKRPNDYAKVLHISRTYLNECVKNATGYSVSHHIRQRVVLEAKRLLYHTDKSVKEIALELHYEDSAYFSRLFSKEVGISPLAFRYKNRD